MRRSGRYAVFAAAMAMMTAMTGQAADIGDFLTGGTGGQDSGVYTSSAEDSGMDTAPAEDGSEYAFPAYDDRTAQNPNAELTGAAASQELNMITCTDSQTGINVARAVVPEGYTVNSETTWCGPVASPDYPASVFIDAVSPDGSIELTYESPLQFLQIVNATVNGRQFQIHQDWTVNTDLFTMMLTYMTAPEYCDYVSMNCMPGTTDMTFLSEKEIPQESLMQLDQLSQQKMEEYNRMLSAAQGLSVDGVEMTVAERTYRYTDPSGKPKILVVSCAGEAAQLQQTVPGYGYGSGETGVTNLIWGIPGRYCLMVDEDRYEEGMTVFESFCNNTTISDQFKQAMSELSQVILQATLQANTGSMSSQSSYVQDTFSSELGGTDDSYSAIDAWDDVIMERNDYTLSSGDSVKVDTSYDYVYELSDGGVYATNSAMDEPAGGTLLYAN